MVRRGTGIGWSTYHMHRRKEIYGEDAEAFRPERWETDELANVGWGFMPFHGGPRMCLGSESLMNFFHLIGADIFKRTSH